MKRFHLIAGLLLFVTFLLTGQYMDRVHGHLEFMADGPRMMYRSRHIYILLSALLHLGIGSYFTYRVGTTQRVLQYIGSAMLTIAPVLFVVGFFYEPKLTGLEGPVSHYGIYITVAGVLLHVLSGIGKR